MKAAFLAAAMIMVPAPVLAQADPVCIRQEIAPGFEQWGKDGARAPAMNRPATLALKPAGTVRFTPALARTPAAGTYGGFYALQVAKAGRYRIALGQRAWIDVVRGGARLESAAHGHGPACSGIAKIVAFDLKPGRHWIQLSDARAPTIGLMVSDRPAD